MNEVNRRDLRTRHEGIRPILATAFLIAIAIPGFTTVSSAASSGVASVAKGANTSAQARSDTTEARGTEQVKVPMDATPTSTPSPIITACAFSDGGFESGTLSPYISAVATCVPGGCGWSVSTVSPHYGTYSAFAPDVANVSDQRLERSAAFIPMSYGNIAIWHNYSFESFEGTFYDGGVLEASTDGGATWADMGPHITTGGYGGIISSCCANPLQGRAAWVGSSGGYVQAFVDLASYSGQNLLIRFREGTDYSNAAPGWYIDEIFFAATCATRTPMPTDTPTFTSTPEATNTEGPTSTGTPTETPGEVTDTPVPATDTPSATPPSCILEFEDVPPGSTFYPFVRCLACAGIINGYPCGGAGEPCNSNNDPYFRPGRPVTRGQLAKIVSQSAGYTDPPVGQFFEDVLPSNDAYPYVERLASKDVMGGYPCGGIGEPCGPGNKPYFRPSRLATRGQLTKILSNAAGFTDPAPSTYRFADVPVGSTFHVYVEALLVHRRGAISGYPCGEAGEPCDADSRPYFRPSNSLTRGQTAKIDSNTFFPECDVP